VAIEGRGNSADLGSFGKCFDKSTSNATGPACDCDVHKSSPATNGTGRTLLQHFPPGGSSASWQMVFLSQCQMFY
jgi:hypothetical protein